MFNEPQAHGEATPDKEPYYFDPSNKINEKTRRGKSFPFIDGPLPIHL